jgi:hypothetical protein
VHQQAGVPVGWQHAMESVVECRPCSLPPNLRTSLGEVDGWQSPDVDDTALKWRKAVSELSGAITLFPIPMTFVVPAIGQSFDLLSGQPGGAIALDASGDQLRATPIKAGKSSYFYLKDTNSFNEALSFSMSAGGGGWGANYGMTADASALLQTTSLTRTIHFRGVEQASQSMVNPEVAVSADAAKILVQGGMDAFVRRYGTHFVAGYVYGKTCNLSFHLSFSTLSLATQFSGTFNESESGLGFSENMQTSISNALSKSQSSCQFGVESNYRGFDSVSPASMTDLAKVVADYDAASDDSTAPVLLVICPWTYMNQINAASGLPINEALEDLASLTNKLVYIKQSSQNFINSNSYAGGSQWKAITNAEQPVQKEMDDILAFLQTCNANGNPVTEEDINNFAAAEPLLDQMNTALQRFRIAFSVVVAGWDVIDPVWTPIVPADELAPQSQAFQLLHNAHQLSTFYNDQSKGVWFDWSASHNLCSIPSGGVVLGFMPDPVNGVVTGWCVATPDLSHGQVSASSKIQGSTNSLGLDDPNNTAKMYWRVEEKGIDITVTLCPV